MSSVMGFLEVAAPQIVAPQDWNLGDRATNAAMAHNITRYPYEVLQTYPHARLVHQGGPHAGQVGLIDYRGLLGYYVKYDVATIQGLGRCATQIKLWRSLYAGVDGLATRVLNDFLLSRFDAVVSDNCHTPDGERFWRLRLSGASSTKTIGCILGPDTIQVYPPGADIEQWLDGVNGWGLHRKFRHIRFFISNRQPAALLPRVEGAFVGN